MKTTALTRLVTAITTLHQLHAEIESIDAERQKAARHGFQQPPVAHLHSAANRQLVIIRAAVRDLQGIYLPTVPLLVCAAEYRADPTPDNATRLITAALSPEKENLL